MQNLSITDGSAVPTRVSDSLRTTPNRRLRLLVVSTVKPQSLRHGTGLRVHHFLRILQNRHDISLLCAAEFKSIPEVQHGLFARIRSLFSLSPYPYQREVHKAVETRMVSDEFDAVLVFGAELLHYVDSCPVPLVADLVDHPIPLRGIGARGAIHFLRSAKHTLSLVLYVRHWCRRIDANLVVSEKDARALSGVIGNCRIEVLPNGVDTTYFAPTGLPVREGEILFFGNMGFEPNVQACHNFAERIFPRILDAFPKAHWTIAGSNPDPSIEQLAAHPSISVTGLVPDLRPYIEQAAVIVSPLVSGTGIKNKILESWAMKKGVVATDFGCAGINARDGVNLLVANDPRSFSDKTVRLLSNPDEARELGRAGYETVVEQYTWEDQARKLEQLLQSVIGTRNL